jgi:hypothetical protein
MNKLVYIYVQNKFVIGQVVLKLLSKWLAVAMMNKTVELFERACIFAGAATLLMQEQEQ